MNRWKFLAIYLPSAAICWGIGYLAGVRNGTGTSVAVGWGGGLVVTILVLLLLRRWRPAIRVERWRAEAVNLRVHDPETYEQILAQAESDPQAAAATARDPDAYVAIFLSFAHEQGALDEEGVQPSA
jgi:hypothetical protein